MKVAIVWNHDSRLLDCSFRFEQYLAGFRTLGHDPFIVCHEGRDTGFPEPAEARPAREFENPELWRELGAEIAVVVTWHRMSRALEAMQTAGMTVIAISDSDGQVGVRVHPWQTFDRLWMYHEGLEAKLKCTKYWVEKYLGDGLGENDEYIASTRHSDVLVLGSSEGKHNFLRFLRHYGQGACEPKLAFAPFAVGASFLSCPVPMKKPDRIVAIGRWADPQKNAALLAATIERFLRVRSTTEIHVLGSGGSAWFDHLARRHPRFDYLGEVDQVDVANALAGCRSIVFSSRWEGSPHAANEALSTGATLIGTPLPSLVSWSDGGRLGRVADRSTARDLSRTMVAEMESWDRGERDARAIATEWRQRLAPANVCRELLSALNSAREASSRAPRSSDSNSLDG